MSAREFEPDAVERLRAYIPEPCTEGEFHAVLDAALDSAEPVLALRSMAEILARNPDTPPGGLPDRLGVLARFLGASPVLGAWMIESPSLSRAALEGTLDQPLSPADVHRRCERACEGVGSEDDLHRALRRFKTEAFVAIGYRDLALSAPLSEVLAGLSAVADAALEAAVHQGAQLLKDEPGAPAGCPPGVVPFCVLSYGKLGGRELNYSSDVDLAFLMGDPDPAGSDGARSAHARRWAERLARLVIGALSRVTEHGMVFRVDLRLRPHGRDGPLVSTLKSALSYLFAHGAVWERQAAIKCRVSAGDRELGARYLARSASFVYRRYLAADAITEIKTLRRRMQDRASRTSRFEIKAGDGGIRDVEYLAQFHQLLAGGRLESVRTGNTLQALSLLNLAGVFTADEAGELSAAYRFLRAAEHRVMLESLGKEHHVPAHAVALQRLAVRMGFLPSRHPDPALAFRAELDEHRSRVRAIYRRHLGNLFADTRNGDLLPDPTTLVLDPDLPASAREKVFSRWGLRDPSRAAETVKRLGRDSLLFSSYSPRTEKYLASLMPALLDRLRHSPDPDRGLANFERVLSAVGAKATYFRLLAENRQALEVLADLCAWSEHLSGVLAANPGLLDAFFDRVSIVTGSGADQPAREIREQLDAHNGHWGAVGDFKLLETLRLGLRDIQGRDNLRATLEGLTDLAEAVTRLALEHAGNETSTGEPAQPAILGLGKLGGREMGYGSDLDVMFVYAGSGDSDAGIGDRAGRVARAVIQRLAGDAEHGALYAVDARLRPQGSQGPLATSLNRLRRYHESGQARTWERLMMTRARPIAGNPALCGALANTVRNLVYRPLPPGWRGEVRDMRERMARHAKVAMGGAGEDLKRGFGGLADIEFIVQALQLEHGIANHDLRVPGTIEALERLGATGLLAGGEREHLATAYQFLRRTENRIRIVSPSARGTIPTNRQELEALARRLGYAAPNGAEAFQAEYRYYTGKTREIFNQQFS